MRCLFCGKRLALLRKLTDGEFCSTAHRKRYLEEEQKLALARLIEEQHRTDRRQSAPSPAAAARGEQRIQEPAGFRTEDLAVRSQMFSPLVAPQALEESTRAWMVERQGQSPAFGKLLRPLETAIFACRELLAAPASAHALIEALECPAPPLLWPVPAGLRTSSALPTAAEPASTAATGPRDSARVSHRKSKISVFLKLESPIRPRPMDLAGAQPEMASILASIGPASAEAARMAVARGEASVLATIPSLAGPGASGLRTSGIDEELARKAEPGEATGLLAQAAGQYRIKLFGEKRQIHAPAPTEVALGNSAAYPAWRRATPEVAPRCACAAKFQMQSAAPAGGIPVAPACETQPGAMEPPARPKPGAALRSPLLGGAGALQLSQAPVSPAFECLATTQTARFEPDAINPASRLRVLETGLRQERETQPAASSLAILAQTLRGLEQDPVPCTPDAVPASRDATLEAKMRPCLPPIRDRRDQDPLPGAVMTQSAAVLAPLAVESHDIRRDLSTPCHTPAPAAPEELLALNYALDPRRLAVSAADSLVPQTLSPKLLFPRLRIQTAMPARLHQAIHGTAEPVPSAAGRIASWMTAPRFWKVAPADLKWLSLAVPAILLVAMVSAIGWLPSKPVQAARAPEPSRSSHLENAVLERWANVRRNIGSRAAVNFQDDFRSGLADWEGRGNWAADWQYDPAGFILTGPLALYRPSLDLTDYRFEFLGQIDKKSLNWVFRSADYNNYYAMKIVFLKSAPLPKAAIVRYAVIGGKQDRPVQLPLPMEVRSDMFFRVRVDVSGENFTTTVQGQVVDFWSDGRLSRGGVGFFSEKGERARLRWMEVSHQYDALGRLCALLAPYSIQSGDGSLNRQ